MQIIIELDADEETAIATAMAVETMLGLTTTQFAVSVQGV